MNIERILKAANEIATLKRSLGMDAAPWVPFTFTQAQSFFSALLGKGKLSTRAYNLINDSLLPLFLRGKGCYGQSAADAYNAVTEYYTHNSSIEANAPDGSADQRKREARQMLLSDKLDATLEQGRKAYIDYCAK